jgi:hypothetical protein
LNFVTQEGGAELGAAGGKVSFDVSTEITPIIGVPLTIGIDYKHKGDQTLSGHAHFDNAPPAFAANTLDQAVTHDLSIPNLLNVGIAYRALPNLLITGAWTLDRFIVYKQDLFVGDLGTTVRVNRDYKNGYTFRLGVEVEDLIRARPRVRVQAGPHDQRDILPRLLRRDADDRPGQLPRHLRYAREHLYDWSHLPTRCQASRVLGGARQQVSQEMAA